MLVIEKRKDGESVICEKKVLFKLYGVPGNRKKSGAYKDALVKQAKELEGELVYKKSNSPALGKVQG